MDESTTVLGIFKPTMTQERWYPSVFALGALTVGFVFYGELTLESLVFSASVAFGAIVSGFTGASLSILMILDSPNMKFIRKNACLKKSLRSYLGGSIFSGIYLFVSSTLCLLTLKTVCQIPDLFKALIFGLWCGTVVYCVCCMVRLSVVMLGLFSTAKNTE